MMPIQTGINRDQLEFNSLESLVDSDSEVRVIDLFLDIVDYDDLGFTNKGSSHEGRPAFAADVLLGIYMYGYLNQIRSSRKLERACRRNVELWWLTGKQMPGYKTLSDFRKDNKKALNNLFAFFRDFCKDIELLGGKTVAIDGSKFRAQNSKKNNFNPNKILRQLAYIEKKRMDYLEQLSLADQQEERLEIESRLQELNDRQSGYENLDRELKESGDTQISTTDSDSRALPLHMNIVEVGYNVQTTVDDKHNLILDYEVTNEKDDYALFEMSGRALDLTHELDTGPLTVLADKGYHTGEELHHCEQIEELETLVSPKAYSPKNKSSYGKEKFTYEAEKDVYRCPAGEELSTNGKWHTHAGKNRKARTVKRYRLKYSECSTCPHYESCVPPGARANKQGKTILRSKYADAVAANKQRVSERKEEYRRRQAIVEAYQRGPFTPLMRFGTIKRQWGYSYTLLRGKEKVQGEFGLIYLCYNFKRLFQILGLKGLKDALEARIFNFMGKMNTTVALVAHKSKIYIFPILRHE